MTKRIFSSIFIVSLCVFLASIVLFLGVLYDYFSGVWHSRLRIETDLAAQGVINEGKEYFNGMDTKNYRITWIGMDGSVLYDSRSAAGEMENHFEREEIRQALAEGIGESARYSKTLTERSLYCAKRLPDGTVLRLSTSQYTVLTLILGMMQPIAVILLFAVVLSLALAARLSKKIVSPLNTLNLDAPLNNEGYDELSPLLHRIDMQQKQIKHAQAELQQKQDEFEAVTKGMTEGLVLLNSKGTILSMNIAARQLFRRDSSCVGEDIFSVYHGVELTAMLQAAGLGRYTEKVIALGNRKYQLGASPVISADAVSGTVLFIVDVTEKEKAEQMRREFTANVSHELKTPLHTISGCAELLVNDMVKKQDVPKFLSQIYTEGQRMIRLVEDIISLSHLDEGANDMAREAVALYQVADETLQSLATQAEAAGIRMTLEGEPATVYGIPQLLREIIYNLCDNAIKYNHKNGSVTVTVKNERSAVVLSVADTGIGISAKHRERIFERFYRVDKSHSKAIGGTGLGLSIVKHAARLHNAVIELESTPNQGTTITVVFSKENKACFTF